jgi:hypothetical protein
MNMLAPVVADRLMQLRHDLGIEIEVLAVSVEGDCLVAFTADDGQPMTMLIAAANQPDAVRH